MDSELVIRQLEYRYKVRNARLQPFFHRIIELRRNFVSFQLTHVPRTRNKRADELANLALDRLEEDSPPPGNPAKLL
jgi:ribonuclease HI